MANISEIFIKGSVETEEDLKEIEETIEYAELAPYLDGADEAEENLYQVLCNYILDMTEYPVYELTDIRLNLSDGNCIIIQ